MNMLRFKDAFLERTIPEPNSGCLLWTGAYTGQRKRPYGKLHIGMGRRVAAHRLAYALAHSGTLPDLCVLHTCDTPECVNADHLFLGTQLENIADREAKGRTSRGSADLTHCHRGHAFTGENTRVKTRADGRKHRDCRACDALAHRAKRRSSLSAVVNSMEPSSS